MIVKLLTEHHLEFPSLKGGCKGSSESTHVKMPHCWKSHALAHFYLALIVVKANIAEILDSEIQLEFSYTINNKWTHVL